MSELKVGDEVICTVAQKVSSINKETGEFGIIWENGEEMRFPISSELFEKVEPSLFKRLLAECLPEVH